MNYHKQKISNSKKEHLFENLEELYSDIPETTGCMENMSECKAWCCKLQNPSVLYSEFLYAWKHIMLNWDMKDIYSLIERSIDNYLSSSVSKTCIMWDRDTGYCKLHTHRCFNCRIYGITPDGTFGERLKRLREQYKDDITASFRDQCGLVKLLDREDFTDEDIDSIWNRLCEIETAAGVKLKHINDGEEGTYRTYHDHILLSFCPDDVLEKLTMMRLNGTPVEKKMFMEKYLAVIRKTLGLE